MSAQDRAAAPRFCGCRSVGDCHDLGEPWCRLKGSIPVERINEGLSDADLREVAAGLADALGANQDRGAGRGGPGDGALVDAAPTSPGSAATRVEYRLSWESPDTWQVASIEHMEGRAVWPTFDWDKLRDWHRTEVVFLEGSDRMGQYHTLKKWAETREQPIRNVVLERREIPVEDEGWEVVS